MRRALSITALALVTGCANVEVVQPVDASAYERCDDSAWVAARDAAARGDNEGALTQLRFVAERCPDFVPGHLERLRLARLVGGESEARVRAEYESSPDRPKSPVVVFLRSRVARNDRDRVDLLEEALRRDASFYFAYIDLADVWGRNDRTTKQLEYLEKAVAAKPDSPEANIGLARVLESFGRGEEAARYFRAYLAVRPDDRESIKEFVRLLVYDMQRVGDAQPWIDRLLAAEPDDVAALTDAAAAWWLRGDRDRAAATFRRVLSIDPRQARAVLNLGNLWFQRPDRADEQRRVDWPKARSAYRYFIALDDYQDADDLRDLMVSVPFRLQVIDAFLGPLPADAPAPRIGDF